MRTKDLAILTAILDELREHPFYGYRKIARALAVPWRDKEAGSPDHEEGGITGHLCGEAHIGAD